MKKSSIAVISIFGTVGGLLLAIGMCMCLLPEWNAFAPGVVLGVGMCLTVVWGTSYLIPGILVGCAGLLICVLNAALRLVKAA
ncbi:MAG TPA: hypothetical protein H9936_03900 [Candidatus Agathobaculum intestinigallinarum]|nr:hypothetical protein [Candidatus Agathobaculum intestinigallinarum]